MLQHQMHIREAALILQVADHVALVISDCCLGACEQPIFACYAAIRSCMVWHGSKWLIYLA
jgi:hypothetical protein